MSIDKNVVLLKLEQIQNCVSRIESKLPFSLQSLESDFDIQDVIAVNLQRAIQVSVDLSAYIIANTNERAPDTMADTFRTLHKIGVIGPDLMAALVKSVGLRNALVHEYDGIKWEVVFDVANNHLNVFRNLATAVLAYISK